MSWVSRCRAVKRRARALRSLGSCRRCGHDWAEHPGAWPHLTSVCGECRYELDHGEGDGAPPCAQQCPVLTVKQVQALEDLWAQVPTGAQPPVTDTDVAWASIDAWFAGVLSSYQAGPAALDLLREIATMPEAPSQVVSLAGRARQACSETTV